MGGDEKGCAHVENTQILPIRIEDGVVVLRELLRDGGWVGHGKQVAGVELDGDEEEEEVVSEGQDALRVRPCLLRRSSASISLLRRRLTAGLLSPIPSRWPPPALKSAKVSQARPGLRCAASPPHRPSCRPSSPTPPAYPQQRRPRSSPCRSRRLACLPLTKA